MSQSIEEQYERVKDEKQKNRPTDNPLFISAILNDIDNGKLVVPEFQRDFEWDLNKFTLLFDSIYRGFTIGNLLLWKTNQQLAHKTIGAQYTKTIDEVEKENREYTYVLDGQQRLTTLYSILRGVEISRKGSKPKSHKIYFDFENDKFIKETEKLEDYNNRTIKKIISDGEFDKFRFIDMSHIFDNNLNFPENLIKPEKDDLWSKSFSGELENKNPLEEKQKIDEVESKLKKFKEIMEWYRIPQIVDYNENIEKVVTVFERINTQNMQLNIFDIMVAKTYEKIKYENKEFTFNLNRAIVKMLLKNDFDKEKLNPSETLNYPKEYYYKIDRVTLLRMLTIYLNSENNITLQKSDIYNIKAQQIQDEIMNFRKILSSIANYSKNQLNIQEINEDYLNNNVLSLITYIFSKKSYRDSDIELINSWFWNSMIFARFPGSQLQLIERDASAFDKGKEYFSKIITQRRNLDLLSEEVKVDNHKLIKAGYDNANSTLYRSCILLLNSLKPKDFDGTHTIDLIDYIGKNTKNEKHHIIPYNSDAGKKLREKYGGDSVINNIANIALISSELNKKISGKDPKKYLEMFESKNGFSEVLESHLISKEMYECLKNEDYEKFLIMRTNKILDLIKRKCVINDESLDFISSETETEE